MRLSLRPERLKRYKDVVALLLKYGRGDLVQQTSLATAGNNDGASAPTTPAKAEELADDLEKLGPTFIKLGQLLSTRGDMLPEPYLEALTRLQDNVEPFPIEEVEQIVSSELGARLSKLFADFDREPTAAASLSQVHRATMRDGRTVVVKVQRPGIREQIVEDLEALEEAADFIDAHTEVGKRYEFSAILAELRRSILRELDFQREASNLMRLGRSMRESKASSCPTDEDFTTSRVLTMEYIPGKKITDVVRCACSRLTGWGWPNSCSAFLKQILVDVSSTPTRIREMCFSPTTIASR